MHTAIVTMTHKPVDLHIWLDYHIKKVGIDIIFLLVDNTPELSRLLDNYPNVWASYDNSYINRKDSYTTQMTRQIAYVREIIKKCNEMNINYLFNIDDDELIYCYNTDIRNILTTVPPDIENIHMNNYEAVFPFFKKNAFDTRRFINRKYPLLMKSYGNGKSCGVISPKLDVLGVHNFAGNKYQVPDNQIVILHFESATYEKWQEKFKRLADTSNEKIQAIPFDFYRSSIRSLDDEDTDMCDLYYKSKIKPYYDYEHSDKLVYFDTQLSFDSRSKRGYRKSRRLKRLDYL